MVSSTASTTAYRRSPAIPRSPNAADSTCSPSIDLTGYRQISEIVYVPTHPVCPRWHDGRRENDSEEGERPMPYQYTEAGLRMQDDVKSFLADHIYPNEAEYYQQYEEVGPNG